MEHPHKIYRKILLQNLKNEDNVKIWFDAGGGHKTGLEKEDHKLLKNIKIVCSDRDKNSLRKNKFADKLILCNLENIPLKNDYADIITLNMVAEHLENPEKVLKELCRVLKTGGKLIIYTPNANNYMVFISKFFPKFYKNIVKGKWWGMKAGDIYPTYYKINTRRIISKILEKHDLKERKFYYLPFTALSRSNFLFYFEYLIVFILSFIKIFDTNILGIYIKLKHK